MNKKVCCLYHSKELSSCKTFNELCCLVNDVDFYELKDLEWIIDIILEINKYGFFTLTSQPGSIINNYKIYKSEWHRFLKKEEGSKQDIRYSRKQRAYIRGYMKTEMADFIIENIKDNEYLFARSTKNNRIFNDKCKLGSVIFIDNEPVVDEIQHGKPKEVLDYDGSFNLRDPLHRDLKRSDYKNLSEECFDGRFVEFDIIDKRFNDNSILWTTLFDLIKIYTQNVYI